MSETNSDFQLRKRCIYLLVRCGIQSIPVSPSKFLVMTLEFPSSSGASEPGFRVFITTTLQWQIRSPSGEQIQTSALSNHSTQNGTRQALLLTFFLFNTISGRAIEQDYPTPLTAYPEYISNYYTFIIGISCCNCRGCTDIPCLFLLGSAPRHMQG